MIPLRDANPTRRAPLVTIALIVVNIVVFLADHLGGRFVAVEVMTPYGPAVGHRFIGGISDVWAMIPSRVTGDLASSWPTVFTSMFIHANWLHVGGNMLYLWIFGNNVEDALGHLGFTVFYAVCGVGAALAHIVTGPQSDIPTVGASGAVAGVMGAYLVLFPGARILALVPIFVVSTLMEVPAVIVIGFWAVIQFLNTNWLGGGEMLSGGGVAYAAHAGGFVLGLVITLALGGRRLLERSARRPREHLW